MKKLIVRGMVFNLSDDALCDIKDTLYYCDEHEGYHIRPDGYAGAMAVAEAMVFAIRDTEEWLPLI